jgi:hypothetical protein
VFERTTGGKAPVEFIKEKKAKAAKVWKPRGIESH